ncbi:MAG: 16S rRNA processing protein RimM [Acidobacteria bacterium]|nr:16S rRNA processing protein RimM [Acidobacteriota bacterium]
MKKPHGIHGDVLVEIITDFPERLQDGVQFGLGDETGPAGTFEVHHVRYHKGGWLLGVSGIQDRETVEAWRGQYIFLPAQDPGDLPEGYHYDHDLVGLACQSVTGEPLGQVIAVDSETPQGLLIVRRGTREFMVPYVPQIVTKIDTEAGVITLDAPAGLLDDEYLEA